MTAPVTVELVVGYLPNDSDKLYDWDETKIEEVLDEFDGNLAKVMRRFWYERWANTFEFININEAGTNRSLEDIHKHAKDMLAYWDDKIELEDKRRISFGEIERPAEC